MMTSMPQEGTVTRWHARTWMPWETGRQREGGRRRWGGGAAWGGGREGGAGGREGDNFLILTFF
jgi:hypothetical protein